MVFTWIYRAIIALMIVFVGWNLYTEPKVTKQLNCALVLVPLVLRVLMIK